MRLFLLAGASLLALSASVAVATAAPIFSDTTPGLTSTTLAAGTYDIVATGPAAAATASVAPWAARAPWSRAPSPSRPPRR